MISGTALSMTDAGDLADKVIFRQNTFNEDLRQSLLVVLLNAGDQFTPVMCIRGEWTGLKKDIPFTNDIPKCPNGHVLSEAISGRKALGWVDVS